MRVDRCGRCKESRVERVLMRTLLDATRLLSQARDSLIALPAVTRSALANKRPRVSILISGALLKVGSVSWGDHA